MNLEAPLKSYVDAKTATMLADGLELHTVGDLLRHYPRRYAERGKLTDLRRLQAGEHVTVLGEVRRVDVRPMKDRRKRMLDVTITDGHATLLLRWFNQPWRTRDLVVGRQALFAGKVEEFKGTRSLKNPEYQLIGDDASDADAAAEFAGAMIPVYPSSEKVHTWLVARCVRLVLDTIGTLDDPLPHDLVARHTLLWLDDALRMIHRPESYDDVVAARRRLKWDEAFVLQVALAQRRREARRTPTPSRVRLPGGLTDAFDESLPFELTEGQQAIGRVVEEELAATHPMHRLLQGEVGSGKTVVALRAMLTVVDAGGQAALMAPTEVLAVQHARSIRDLLGPLGMAGELGGAEVATQVALLTGSMGAAARRNALASIADGSAGIVVGTHALLETGVVFRDLGLVVVDEQHRFGVEQRDVLRAKGGSAPHVLVMTATPIPRTVAMTVYGDLETSTLRELPRGRSPIRTAVVPAAEKPGWLDAAWGRVREQVAEGRQAFVVCPRIGEAESEEPTGDEPADPETRRPPLAVADVFPMLRDGPFAGLRVEMLHGRLPADAKDAVMRRFARGDIDVVVATTVIEVGVDVPNATVMIVMDADRFGISQLHQLRGRIGRGSAPGLCLLVTDMPAGTPARERLDAVAATADGFELARLDLAQRREGDVLGASQSGRRSSVRLLELLEDEDLIVEARAEATALVERDPELATAPALAAELARAVDEERAEYLEKA
ncbi:MAG TPA: ATP-dependent DNA helicase RecG [Mycobacteriales bacterium]|nr:ATP-dependent DNA helicase RecG [Mycobacteriales bacterium]